MFIENRKARIRLLIFLLFTGFYLTDVSVYAQQKPENDSLLTTANLENVVNYALKHQPLIMQSVADEHITAMQVKSELSAWLPQVNFNYLYQHNFQLSANVIGGNLVVFGVKNTSALQFSLNQTIFNRDVLLARKAGKDVLLSTRQQSQANKIDIAVNVSKAFYDVLATQQQLKVAEENIIRLERSLYDASAQYEAGVVDKTDSKRAVIALNNARALQKNNVEQVRSKMAYLRTLMNYPQNAELNLIYDSVALLRETELDTLQMVEYNERIEVQQMETQRRLLEANLQYSRWSYIPSLSAFGSFNMNYFNDYFDKLYQKPVQNSFAGLTLAFPIFQGGKRKFNIREAEWQLRRTEWGIEGLKNNISSEYQTALATYKSALEYFVRLKENVVLAREVYDIIDLQYRSGIKAYIEVIAAESELRSAQINYFEAIYQLLSSKLDVMRSLGQLKYE